jgi:hypothetical protein
MGLKPLRLLTMTVLSAASVASVASAQAEGPAVSTVNGKLSTEAGVTGINGESSGIGVVKGSLAAPLGYAFGFQLDGMAGTSFNSAFGGGTAHLFWRDPAIGLFGPVVSLAAGGGNRLGWYGSEAELYAKAFTIGAWGGYHDAVDGQFAITESSGFYGGSFTFYPTPDLAMTLAATSAFGQVSGTSTIEYQPDLFARHNVAFYVDGAAADHASYGITVGVRLYFGPDKSLIRRHREDDPVTALAWEAAAERATSANLVPGNLPGKNTPANESQYGQTWALP